MNELAVRLSSIVGFDELHEPPKRGLKAICRLYGRDGRIMVLEEMF
jgi:hypothetical protein